VFSEYSRWRRRLYSYWRLPRVSLRSRTPPPCLELRTGAPCARVPTVITVRLCPWGILLWRRRDRFTLVLSLTKSMLFQPNANRWVAKYHELPVQEQSQSQTYSRARAFTLALQPTRIMRSTSRFLIGGLFLSSQFYHEIFYAFNRPCDLVTAKMIKNFLLLDLTWLVTNLQLNSLITEGRKAVKLYRLYLHISTERKHFSIFAAIVTF